MIKFEQYNVLSPNDQAALLIEEGVYLELMRNEREMVAELYALDDFYVEVFFSGKTDAPLFLRAFSDTSLLERYLGQINLNALLEPLQNKKSR
jgi:hypothetical protein